MSSAVHSVVPFLWFDRQALPAAELYTSLFDDGRIVSVTAPPPGTPGVEGEVMSVTFELGGLELYALNGGPAFSFTEAISLFVRAETQQRIDFLWEALTADGGEESQCGWLKDRFGLSWQIVPPQLLAWMSDPDPAVAERVTRAMLTMRKLDLATLEAASRS